MISKNKNFLNKKKQIYATVVSSSCRLQGQTRTERNLLFLIRIRMNGKNNKKRLISFEYKGKGIFTVVLIIF